MTDYFADDIIQNKLGITDDIKLQAAEEKIISEKDAKIAELEKLVADKNPKK